MASYEASYLLRDVMSEGVKQLKRDVEVLVQHRKRRGNYREVSACKLGFLYSKDVNLHFQEGWGSYFVYRKDSENLGVRKNVGTRCP